MMRVGSWLYGKKANASTQSLDSLAELKDSATFILNDDVDGAENGLAKGTSTFHNLGKGVVAFVRATLGFEQEIMRQASERLYEAETSAASEQHRAQHNSHAPHAFRSEIYAPGTEYALCQAIAQLMSAVVGVLNESLTESIKAFYRLRKAYIALDAILKMEEKFMELRDPSRELLTSSSDLSKIGPSRLNTSNIFQNEIDVFVHSGANFCFGILLLLISMVPPAFSKLLSIIGFRGDKQRGLRMLWQASKFHNLIGAMAALALLGYYNGFVRYCDIMPDPTSGEDDVEGYPQERLATLLAEMRSRFPNSRLWLAEESRMRGANKDLEGALEILSSSNKSPLKQVEALCTFEKSLNALFLHKYDVCCDAFIEPVTSHFTADALSQILKQAEKHAATAAEYIRKAPSHAGKKKFMARQLPFDVFVTRKIAKWEARAKAWNVPLVNAIGVDPVEEMIFFWNGHSRMTEAQLEESLSRLAWCESDANATWSREGPEEKAILDLIRAAVHRSLHNYDKAKQILKTGVLNHDKAVFKGNLKDDWVLPAAHFEMAANLWMERPTYQALHGLSDQASTDSGEKKPLNENEQVRECKEYLEHAARWESYELDARIGLKVTAAIEAVNKWESMP
ncbi:uncharacterized protein N7477_000949 [Penicillium maclennaniae]|uniref:uncharacterized protein n=1 Tax=Penicillium maclennaniae TaxID=1343394 RepID=UPI0025420525|nr:uncharacterized protein N7477_000949 [Penicillium maclennaniae]KAJ5684604.1 hypothetical protein N7477_000949 [Penicillium maclennaniae]